MSEERLIETERKKTPSVRIRQEFRTEEQIHHAQKMESLGTLAGGMAHDMNNILASIMAVASAMEAEMAKDEKYFGDVQDILCACKRGSALTKSLLGFARRSRMNKTTVHMNDLANQTASILSRSLAKDVNIVLDLDGDLFPTVADPDQLSNLLMNICLNGMDAMGKEGTLTIRTENLSAPDRVRLVVKDTGPGIPKDIIDKVFDPFFTTKPKGRGTGLGLSTAYGTVKTRGFHTNLQRAGVNQRYGGLTGGEVEDVQQLPGPPPVKVNSRSGTVLLVDDEDLFRVSAKRILEKLGYAVLTAENGRSALEVHSQNADKIDVVILDMIMPILGGRETFETLRTIDPQLPVLISSGYTEEESVKDLIDGGAIGFISKPFDMRSLSEALRDPHVASAQ